MKDLSRFCILMMMVVGCRKASPNIPEGNFIIPTSEEDVSAVTAVAEHWAGRKPNVRYCPVDGKHFSSRLQLCPEHQVKLKELED